MSTDSTDLLSSLRAIARKIEEWQNEQQTQSSRLSDVQLVRKFGHLGSTKTYRRILDGTDDLADLDVERQHHNYGLALELIELERKREKCHDNTIADLTPARLAKVSALEAYGEQSNQRVVILLGPSGSGKTRALEVIEQNVPGASVRIEADETWKIAKDGGVRALLSNLMRRLGGGLSETKAAQTSTVLLLQHLISQHGARNMIVMIDEAHHMSQRAFNTVKTMINKTSWVIVLAAIQKLWDDLAKESYQEVIQLTTNRLYERIQLPEPKPEEISKFCARRGLTFEEKMPDEVWDSIAKSAYNCGRWAFVTALCRNARRASKGSALSRETFIEAVRRTRETR